MSETQEIDVGDLLFRERVISEGQLGNLRQIQDRMQTPRWLGHLAVELGYAYRADVDRALARHGKKLPFLDYLVSKGILDVPTAAELAEEIKSSGTPVYDLLLKREHLTRLQLLQARANRLGIPLVNPVLEMLDGELLKVVPMTYLETNQILPISQDGAAVTVAVCEPETTTVVDDLEKLFGKRIRLALAPPDLIAEVFEAWKDGLQPAGEAELVDRGGNERVRSGNEHHEQIPQLSFHLLRTAARRKVSDIHIEPLEGCVRVRFRVDGVLVPYTELPYELYRRLVTQIKILAECNVSDRLRHQDGRFSISVGDDVLDFRVSVYVTIFGENVVIRILNRQAGGIGLSEIGMAPAVLGVFRDRALALPSGVILVTGPTGSGKTTTLYSALQHLNKTDAKIITAEDPVEFTVSGVVQCQINTKVGRDFEATLRSIVRQDPDIIMLGEIRDRLSAEVAVQAALTGHKVLSTFHSEDCVGGLVRLLDMEIDAFLISSTVICVMGQRLVRRICPECREPYKPPPEELALVGVDSSYFSAGDLVHGRGCAYCSGTGYTGRTGVFELILVDKEVKAQILARAPSHVIRQRCRATSELPTMLEDGLALVGQGKTTLTEVCRMVPITSVPRPLADINAVRENASLVLEMVRREQAS